MESGTEMTLRDRVYSNLVKRRNNLLEGGMNSIPSPFKRFSEDFIGVEPATYYCCTSFTKGGKSQFVSNVFIYNSLIQAYENPDKIAVKILYFPLEETPERILERFISFLLFRTFGIEVSPRDLRSSKNDRPLPEEVLEKIQSPGIQNMLRFFEENVIFSGGSNPTGIYKFCKKYAEDNGTVFYTTVEYTDKEGKRQTYRKFDRYEPVNPREIRIIVLDTINLIDTERGFTLKQSMDKMSEMLAKELRNKYLMSPVVIQQQAFDSEGNEAFKLGRVRPSVAGLGDSKYISRDANIVLGLFSPARFDIPEYMGYSIKDFKDSIRFLEVIVNRDGDMGGMVALYFNGKVSQFEELPLPSDKQAMDKWYSWLRTRRESRTVKSFFIYGIRKKERELRSPGFFLRFAALFGLGKVKRTNKMKKNG